MYQFGSLTATDEQSAILDAVLEGNENLQLVARAGAAKTSTLQMIAEVQPKRSILSLAFNKAIATEMKERLPSNCQSLTLNALGHRAIGGFFSKWPKVKADKMYSILRDLNPPPKGFADLLSACRQAKALGYFPSSRAKSLVDEEELFKAIDLKLDDTEKGFVLAACKKSADMVWEGTIDFDDQILVSTLCSSISFDRYQIVLVDEAQDLSSLNHAMLAKIAKGNTRVIIAGDPLQAIYAFRGAHTFSMEALAERFDCHSYSLNTTFRCAKKIVRHVNKFAPDMVARHDAPEGIVEEIGRDWNLENIPTNSAIICRRNAPLFYLSLQFFLARIPAEFVGNDAIIRLENILKGIRDKRARKAAVLRHAEAWKEERLTKNKDSQHVRDMYDCLILLAESFDTLQEIRTFLRQQRNIQGRIKLLTVHKAKGLEFGTSFILQQSLFSEEGQESNIQYVAKTRSRDSLYYLDFWR